MIPWLGERELRITFPDWVEPHPHSSHLGAILGSAQRACAQSAPAGALTPALAPADTDPNHRCLVARRELSVQDHKPSSALAREGGAHPRCFCL